MKLLIQSILLTLVFTVITGIAYPLAVTGLAQLLFRNQANGSLLQRDGKIAGSALLAQPFAGATYFWPRPSAGSYATVPSGASNLGPTSPVLQSNVVANARAFREGNHLPDSTPVPADMVFTSGSGLDPHISPEAARLQIARVAEARTAEVARVTALVAQYTERPQLGFLGEPRVNVLKLNLALDRAIDLQR